MIVDVTVAQHEKLCIAHGSVAPPGHISDAVPPRDEGVVVVDQGH